MLVSFYLNNVKIYMSDRNLTCIGAYILCLDIVLKIRLFVLGNSNPS